MDLWFQANNEPKERCFKCHQLLDLSALESHIKSCQTSDDSDDDFQPTPRLRRFASVTGGGPSGSSSMATTHMELHRNPAVSSQVQSCSLNRNLSDSGSSRRQVSLSNSIAGHYTYF